MITLPNKCLREKDSQPYAQIKDNETRGYICCGKRGEADNSYPGDKYCQCFVGATADECSYNDRRDLVDQLSIIAQALSVIENKTDLNDCECSMKEYLEIDKWYLINLRENNGEIFIRPKQFQGEYLLCDTTGPLCPNSHIVERATTALVEIAEIVYAQVYDAQQ